MIIFQHGRSDWVDPRYPVTGPAFNWAGIEWVVLHYTAAIDLIDGDLGEFAYNLPPYLRAIHRDYLGRGYSIGYNAAVDWLGGDWELRGDTFKCAANADREDTIESEHDKGGDENARTFAILMLVDGQDGATPLAAAKVRGLVAQIREQAPRAVVVLGHRDVDKTQCPGTGVYAQIKAGVFEPVVEPEPPPPPPDPDPVPPPPAPTPITDLEEPTMWLIGRTSDTGDRYLASPRPRGGAYHVPSEVPGQYPFDASGGQAFDVGSGTTVSSWGACKKVPQAQLLAVMGAEV